MRHTISTMEQRRTLYLHFSRILFDALTNRARRLDAATWFIVTDTASGDHNSFTLQYSPRARSPGVTMTVDEVTWLISCIPKQAWNVKGVFHAEYGSIAATISSKCVRLMKVKETPLTTTSTKAKYTMDIPHSTMVMLKDAFFELFSSLVQKNAINCKLNGSLVLGPVELQTMMIYLARRVNKELYPRCSGCVGNTQLHVCGITSGDLLFKRGRTALDFVTIDLLQSVLNFNGLWCPVNLLTQVAPPQIRVAMAREVFSVEKYPEITALVDNYMKQRPPCDDVNPPHISNCWLLT